MCKFSYSQNSLSSCSLYSANKFTEYILHICTKYTAIPLWTYMYSNFHSAYILLQVNKVYL